MHGQPMIKKLSQMFPTLKESLGSPIKWQVNYVAWDSIENSSNEEVQRKELNPENVWSHLESGWEPLLMDT
jgi:hypothetical protein